jgi:hypothetical protein
MMVDAAQLWQTVQRDLDSLREMPLLNSAVEHGMR